MIPRMRNAVPTLAQELAEKAVAGRLESYAGEVRRAPRRRVRGDGPHRRHRPEGRRHREGGRALEPGLLPALRRARTRCSSPCSTTANAVWSRRSSAACSRSSPVRRGCARGSRACSSRRAIPKPPRTRARSRSTASVSTTVSPPRPRRAASASLAPLRAAIVDAGGDPRSRHGRGLRARHGHDGPLPRRTADPEPRRHRARRAVRARWACGASVDERSAAHGT